MPCRDYSKEATGKLAMKVKGLPIVLTVGAGALRFCEQRRGASSAVDDRRVVAVLAGIFGKSYRLDLSLYLLVALLRRPRRGAELMDDKVVMPSNDLSW
jgi:hypothetical protein